MIHSQVLRAMTLLGRAIPFFFAAETSRGHDDDRPIVNESKVVPGKSGDQQTADTIPLPGLGEETEETRSSIQQLSNHSLQASAPIVALGC
jgi:hypothetical protein